MKQAAPRPLSDLIDATLGPVLAAQGFASSDIVASWPDVVGETLATRCEPIKISWPKRIGTAEASEPATLVIRVESAFALELQHLAPVLIERVNTRYGWKAVGKILLKQGPIRKTSRPVPLPAPTAEVLEKAREKVGALENSALKDALVRLGAGVLTRKT